MQNFKELQNFKEIDAMNLKQAYQDYNINIKISLNNIVKM